MDRRGMIKTITVTLPFLAGCSGLLGTDGDESETETDNSPTDSSPTETPAETATQTVAQTVTTNANVGTDNDISVTPGNPGSVTIDPNQFQTYSNSTYGYSIQYPGSWQIDDSLQAEVEISHPQGIPTIRIDVNEDQSQIPLNTLSEQLDAYLAQTFAEYEPLDKRMITLQSGQEAIVVESRIRMESGGGSVTLYDKYSLCIAGGRMYMVQTMASEQNYPSVSNQFDMIIESLAINA